jgi:hypothetical protein
METNYASENYLLVQGDIEHATNADRKYEMRRIKKHYVVQVKRAAGSRCP